MAVCTRCGKEIITPQNQGFGGTGYAIGADGQKICYVCCAEADRQAMDRLGQYDLYLVERADGWHVTNWPGTLDYSARVTIHPKGHFSPIGGYMERRDAWFKDHKGQTWHGRSIGDFTQVCHCKRQTDKDKESRVSKYSDQQYRYQKRLTDRARDLYSMARSFKLPYPKLLELRDQKIFQSSEWKHANGYTQHYIRGILDSLWAEHYRVLAWGFMVDGQIMTVPEMQARWPTDWHTRCEHSTDTDPGNGTHFYPDKDPSKRKPF